MLQLALVIAAQHHHLINIPAAFLFLEVPQYVQLLLDLRFLGIPIVHQQVADYAYVVKYDELRYSGGIFEIGQGTSHQTVVILFPEVLYQQKKVLILFRPPNNQVKFVRHPLVTQEHHVEVPGKLLGQLWMLIHYTRYLLYQLNYFVDVDRPIVFLVGIEAESYKEKIIQLINDQMLLFDILLAKLVLPQLQISHELKIIE